MLTQSSGDYGSEIKCLSGFLHSRVRHSPVVTGMGPPLKWALPWNGPSRSGTNSWCTSRNNSHKRETQGAYPHYTLYLAIIQMGLIEPRSHYLPFFTSDVIIFRACRPCRKRSHYRRVLLKNIFRAKRSSLSVAYPAPLLSRSITIPNATYMYHTSARFSAGIIITRHWGRQGLQCTM